MKKTHSALRYLAPVFVIFALCLLLASCVQTSKPELLPASTSVDASSSSVTPTDSEEPAFSMTPLAEQFGITAENYPKIDGSTSTLGIVQAVWTAMVQPDTAAYEALFPRNASKTVPSYHLLMNGDVDLIFVPYASEEILREAEEAGVELEFHKIAAEALIFITPKENSAENITEDQVRSIYLKNAIPNWSDLGGPDRKLVPICRNADSGSQSQMDNLILHDEPMDPEIENNYVELTMEGMLQQVASYHNGGLSGEPTDSYALGYTLYSYLENVNKITGIGEDLKILAFEGVVPTRQSIADGIYPLSDGYYAVVRKDLPEDHSARSVIRWLQSSEGAEKIESFGLISCAQ